MEDAFDEHKEHSETIKALEHQTITSVYNSVGKISKLISPIKNVASGACVEAV